MLAGKTADDQSYNRPTPARCLALALPHPFRYLSPENVPPKVGPTCPVTDFGATVPHMARLVMHCIRCIVPAAAAEPGGGCVALRQALAAHRAERRAIGRGLLVMRGHQPCCGLNHKVK